MKFKALIKKWNIVIATLKNSCCCYNSIKNVCMPQQMVNHQKRKSSISPIQYLWDADQLKLVKTPFNILCRKLVW